MLKKELEEEKERNILERKRKVALGAILTECQVRLYYERIFHLINVISIFQKRVEPQVASCASVEKEINEMKMVSSVLRRIDTITSCFFFRNLKML